MGQRYSAGISGLRGAMVVVIGDDGEGPWRRRPSLVYAAIVVATSSYLFHVDDFNVTANFILPLIFSIFLKIHPIVSSLFFFKKKKRECKINNL